MDRLDAELDRVLRQLDAMPELRAAQGARAQVAAADPAQALARLAVLLDRGDGAALDLVEEARDALAAALGEQGWRQVEAAVNDFDFERALVLLDAPPGGA